MKPFYNLDSMILISFKSTEHISGWRRSDLEKKENGGFVGGVKFNLTLETRRKHQFNLHAWPQ